MHNNETFLRRYGNEGDDNDDDENMEQRLINKTSKLKQITISLGNEIRDSNKYIKGLDDDFDKSKNYMDSAMKGIYKLSKNPNCKLYFYLILFSLFVFFVLYLLIKFS